MPTIGSATTLGRRIDQWTGELAAARRSPLTLSAYRSDIHLVGMHLAAEVACDPDDLDVSHLTRENLVGAFARFAEDHSPASIRRAMATYGSLCRYLTDITSDLVRNPVETIRRPEMPVRPPRLIDDDDYARKILAAAGRPEERSRTRWPTRDVALLATYLLLGLRLTEALIIRPRDISRGETTTVLVRGKRSYQRVVVVPDVLLAMWDRYLSEAAERFGPLHSDSPIIRHSVTGRALSRQSGQWLVDRIYRDAGIRDKVPTGALVHALRHGFATESVRAGASLIDLRDHLGHSSLTVTDQYLHSDPRRRRDLVEQHPFVRQLGESLAAE